MIRIIYSNYKEDSASKRVRILDPLRKLVAGGGYEIIALEANLSSTESGVEFDAETFVDADILFLHMADCSERTVFITDKIKEFLACRGKRLFTVLDTDDDYFIDVPSSPFNESIRGHELRLQRQVEKVELVTVTGEYLKNSISKMNPRVVGIPNFVEPEKYSSSQKQAKSTFRIGWCGGPTHLDDLTIIMPALKRLQQRYDIEIVLFGLYDGDMKNIINRAQAIPENISVEPNLAAVLRFSRALGSLQYEHVPGVSFEEFPQKLSELNFDIGVCPLLDTEFNRCRSAIKYYQYAAAGVVTVASNVIPYQEECNYLAENTTDDWYTKLSTLLENAQLRNAVLEQQRDYVLKRRTYAQGIEFYRSLFSRLVRNRKECDEAEMP